MASPTSKTPRILIIAGSDSGGGAGIQADIKTVTMLGGHAMTAITAVTAQNTLGVDAVHPVPAEMILAQIDSVIADIGAISLIVTVAGVAGAVVIWRLALMLRANFLFERPEAFWIAPKKPAPVLQPAE